MANMRAKGHRALLLPKKSLVQDTTIFHVLMISRSLS